jgi:hypothetical protein
MTNTLAYYDPSSVTNTMSFASGWTPGKVSSSELHWERVQHVAPQVQGLEGVREGLQVEGDLWPLLKTFFLVNDAPEKIFCSLQCFSA